MIQTPVSQRYAKALYSLALDQHLVDKVYASVLDLGKILDQVPALKEFVDNPLMSAEERSKIVASVFKGKVPELVFKFLLFLSAKNRLNHLPGIVGSFDDQYLKAHDQIRAHVQTALPLDETVKSHVLKALSDKYGKKVLINWQIRKDILGGFRILIDGNLLDYSFTSQLAQYRQKALF